MTVSNTGHTNGARALLQGKLGKELLSFGCRHYIFELVLQAAFSACSSRSDVHFFVIFTEQWRYIDQHSSSTSLDYNATASGVSALRQDMLLFPGEQLRAQ